MAKSDDDKRKRLLIAAREGLRKGKCERSDLPIGMIRFKSPVKGIERGTVICADGSRVVYGYPHIKRIFTLRNGLERNITSGKVFIEEKIDGFNVRIASIGGEVFGFSRGGFLDPFVTEKAREMGLGGFFSQNPDMVIYGEMIGNTPYTEPTEDFDVRLFIFDIGEGDGSFLPCEERYALIKRHDLEGVPVLGRFSREDIKGISDLALALNKGGKEGMVIKSGDRSEVVKYVTPDSDIRDIRECSDIIFDMPIGFYYQRVLRSAFFVHDFGLDQKEYARRIGEAFYSGLMQALKKAGRGEEMSAEFEISVKDPAVWDGIVKHMGRDVRLDVLWKRREGKRTRIRFQKVYKKTSAMLHSLAGGKAVAD